MKRKKLFQKVNKMEAISKHHKTWTILQNKKIKQ